jgi:hypothetical protein
MTESTLMTDYLGRGVAAARPASVTVASGVLALWFSTDTGELDYYTGSGWTTLAGGLGRVNTWTAAQRGAVVALTDAATITSDFSLGNNFSVTLGGNRTLGNPSNVGAGQAGQIVVTQDGTGSRTLTLAANWFPVGGSAPTWTAAAGAIDIITYYTTASGHISYSVLNNC